MKKFILVVAVMAIFVGCANTQDKIDKYVKVRNKTIKTVHGVKCEKTCIKSCNTISNVIDRVDCKASCVSGCHNE